ncbi:putative 3-demethylubiquinone-9 3-methyltransferase (glyoxalase superfamily) [Paraburkholderia youngii]|uniref:Putative 3-demethylubiquinone-9 3-methyltransferase (Glyoxalase superfamily) n=1 Tax=Paraburkholderia youngii TaxID=2782701 RepID=A0A7W8LA46_9BURK|nr:VOC family protein [Paraburkholderia youngii]MBB5403267.1 putative 3-demethylubiquinone-9 3-methyltransferase (glyoxalase superfamily) [Paraburkholderia youngii]
MQKIAPCLWFDGNAEEAAEFYTSVFPASRIATTLHSTDVGPGPAGEVVAVTFEIEGQEFMVLNGGPQYKFTPAISLMVHCDSQEEVDRYWSKLLDGGEPVACGWLRDRFGVSWQITPNVLLQMLRDPDRAKASRVMAQMMKMVKLDIAPLEQAYRGE